MTVHVVHGSVEHREGGNEQPDAAPGKEHVMHVPKGGQIVFEGPPEELTRCSHSYTARFLKAYLAKNAAPPPDTAAVSNR